MDHHHEDEVFEDPLPFEDRKQNFWQLAAIQSAAFGVPTIALGQELAQKEGAGTALCSISIGNLILWIIALATVAMAYSERKNAIQNLRFFVGRIGSLAGGLILLFAFLFWYSLQITSAMSIVDASIVKSNLQHGSVDIRIGVTAGLVIALLSIGGIKVIKWAAVIIFPFLFVFVIFSVLSHWGNPVFCGELGSFNARNSI